MTLTDRTIEALRANHDELAAVVASLSPEQLTARSGAEEWSVAQVFSHLGSSAEIMLHPVAGAIAGMSGAEQDNQAIWDRWNAMSPEDQAAGFVEQDERLVRTLEALSAEMRASLRVELGFLPEPAPLELVVGMRLNEVAAHAWDIRVALDPEAGLHPESAALLLEHFAGGLGFLLGFVGKHGELEQPATVALGDHAVVIDVGVKVVEAGSVEPTATFDGPLEAGVRLLSGRLKSPYTPAGAEVCGNVSLDDLRKVFPGY